MNKKRIFIILLLTIASSLVGSEITKYVRYTYQGQESYGILEGDTIRELEGHIFSSITPSGKSLKLSEVQLLAPCKPSKVIAVGLNYRSHIGKKPIPEYPGLFAKYPSSIIGHGENIVMTSDATNLHFEGEMVIVIGKKAKNISVSDAHNFIFGITAGNDVSERKWQRADLQWLRAKASDTFGPIGPAIVTGLNYNDLLLQTRLNGKVQQSERTKDLVYNVDTIVSYISQYITLLPGDLIFTGTPGKTKAMKPNDVVEIELEGVGVLRNTVVVGK
jgi:2-keto-4-pentenoate hydratase/2-oxohepta-3-ene-1,7-dioic acid hydratase in catechol pathway